ncbi:conserved exported hypothetical protein [Syntrophobacter sp. SbD1]|nr:conserved exported hypothetical protein [Syntrophobacter sp. SbD1]
MKRTVALIFLPLFLLGLASVSLADEVTLKPSGEGQWAILDSGGQEIGTLAKVEEGAYSILPKGGQYIGIVRSDGNLQMTGRHPTMSPSQAQLYLDVLEAIKTLK